MSETAVSRKQAMPGNAAQMNPPQCPKCGESEELARSYTTKGAQEEEWCPAKTVIAGEVRVDGGRWESVDHEVKRHSQMSVVTCGPCGHSWNRRVEDGHCFWDQ